MVNAGTGPDTAARTLITELRTLLGTKIVAYLTEAPDTATVRGWVDGTTPLPDQAILNRLHIALDAARRIGTRDTPAVAQTWFQGRNPALDNQPPAQLLREANLDSVRTTILAAATEFATHST
ncbi:DUF2384 domain-containing protein [Rhodococcus opacus]|uniref:DUF2384 domain-containing protein n=1 Tax=Rhodococcus opacus TaxID=37919 RepID=A0AAX3YQK3_RHOOP|nr:antitoxin Xre/MbcA/ParS toxin-binding domain-containing protein [Rhodococcus opacus]MCZ4589668.1 DUF2384 domain-containing protein [Rhodococcus opacus]WLF51478.1 DUF2384 domain-containing protein [Rhodococcus opacus]